MAAGVGLWPQPLGAAGSSITLRVWEGGGRGVGARVRVRRCVRERRVGRLSVCNSNTGACQPQRTHTSTHTHTHMYHVK